jgi:hypothetical protein
LLSLKPSGTVAEAILAGMTEPPDIRAVADITVVEPITAEVTTLRARSAYSRG